MLLSELRVDRSVRNTGRIVSSQRVKIKCDKCNSIFDICYKYVLDGRTKYSMDLCRKCKAKIYITSEMKEKSRERITQYNKNQKGKTFEERLGIETAIKTRKKLSEIGLNGRGAKGLKWTKEQKEHLKQVRPNTGTYEEKFGEEKAKKIKQKISRFMSGPDCPSRGKPAPQGSGNGWSGWYKGWYFRSFLELSYMINVIEKQKLNWKNGELKEYKIPYIDYDGKQRNYFPDFVIENKIIIEIKPKNLKNSQVVLSKKQGALEWCKKYNFEYQLILSNEFQNLTKEEIKILHDSNKIKFIDRYEEKYKNWGQIK